MKRNVRQGQYKVGGRSRILSVCFSQFPLYMVARDGGLDDEVQKRTQKKFVACSGDSMIFHQCKYFHLEQGSDRPSVLESCLKSTRKAINRTAQCTSLFVHQLFFSPACFASHMASVYKSTLVFILLYSMYGLSSL